MTTYTDSFIQDRPRTIYFYATDLCNSQCPFCKFRAKNHFKRNSFHLGDVIRVWNESEYLGGDNAPKVVLQGGEFLLHPQSANITAFFRAKNIQTILLTNAVDISSKDIFPAFNSVTISLDGPDHDSLRGVDGNLKNIISVLDDQQIVDSGVKISLQLTLGPWNCSWDSVKFVLDLAEKYKRQVRLNVTSTCGLLGGEEKDSTAFDIYSIHSLWLKADWDKYIQSGTLTESNVGYVESVLLGSLPQVCFSTSMYSTILADGTVLVCQGLIPDKAKIGNVMEASFDQIWDAAADTRRSLISCRNCSLSCQLMGDLEFLNERNL